MKITHIYHSGFAVELEHSVLIFDWYQGKLPAFDPAKTVYVFVSHSHPDHYNPKIFSLKKTFPRIFYILDEDTAPDRQDAYHVQPDRTYKIGEISVQTLLSTDQGTAYYVEVEGHTIFHAGDLNVWYWNNEPKADNEHSLAIFRREIARLKGHSIEAAFIPLDPRLEENAPMAAAEFMKEIGCRMMFPMHYWDRKKETESYLHDSRLADFADRINFADEAEL